MATDRILENLAVENGLQWKFSEGFAPLWLRGNWDNPGGVRLILLLAEPSTPDPGETFSTKPESWFRAAVRGPDTLPPFGLEHQERGFQQKIEWFLQECGFDLDDHASVWSQIIVTNTFWLRLPDKFQQAPRTVEDYFIKQYLTPILHQLPNAIVIGAGGKAHRRLRKTGVSFINVGALAPPGCYQPKIMAQHKEVANKIRLDLFA